MEADRVAVRDGCSAGCRRTGAELQRKGYPLSDGPTPTGDGSLIAFIDAPEGYEVELIQREA